MELWMVIAGLAAGLLVFALARASQKVTRQADAAPLLRLLAARKGAPDEEFVKAAGVALRRCTFCSAGELCRQKLEAGEPIPDYCPNAEFVASVGKLRAT